MFVRCAEEALITFNELMSFLYGVVVDVNIFAAKPLKKTISQCQACFIRLIIIYLFYHLPIAMSARFGCYTYELFFKDFHMLYIIRKAFYR